MRFRSPVLSDRDCVSAVAAYAADYLSSLAATYSVRCVLDQLFLQGAEVAKSHEQKLLHLAAASRTVRKERACDRE